MIGGMHEGGGKLRIILLGGGMTIHTKTKSKLKATLIQIIIN